MRSKDPITFRGSLTDFATDIAFEITTQEAYELVREIARFLAHEPSKFKPDEKPTDPTIPTAAELDLWRKGDKIFAFSAYRKRNPNVDLPTAKALFDIHS